MIAVNATRPSPLGDESKPPTNVMARLKTETKCSHAAAESTALSASMLNGTIQLNHYIAHLVYWKEMWIAVENAIAESPPSSIAQEFKTVLGKSTWIEKDLAALSLNVPLNEVGLVQLNQFRQFVNGTRSNPASLLGILYVFEGSSLGAAFLLPRLRASLALQDDGTTYYRGHGPKTGELWRAFSAQMNALLTSRQQQDDAVRAATQTFEFVCRVYEAVWNP